MKWSKVMTTTLNEMLHQLVLGNRRTREAAAEWRARGVESVAKELERRAAVTAGHIERMELVSEMFDAFDAKFGKAAVND